MQSFSQHFVDLVLQGLVEPEIAAGASGNKHDFEIALSQALRTKAAEESEDSGIAPTGPKLLQHLSPQPEDPRDDVEPEIRDLRVAG